jgi:hypothetical protein
MAKIIPWRSCNRKKVWYSIERRIVYCNSNYLQRGSLPTVFDCGAGASGGNRLVISPTACARRFRGYRVSILRFKRTEKSSRFFKKGRDGPHLAPLKSFAPSRLLALPSGQTTWSPPHFLKPSLQNHRPYEGRRQILGCKKAIYSGSSRERLPGGARMRKR